MRTRTRSILFRAGLLGLVPLSAVTCTADSPQPTGTAGQAVINPPLPSNLNLILNAKTTVTVGAFTVVAGDVASGGVKGSVLFDVSSSQPLSGGFNVLANTVTVNVAAMVDHVFGNFITVNGSAEQQSLGLDPTTLPPVPAVTPANPGTTNVSTNQNQSKQLCSGRYGAISLGQGSTLSLNGGVYQVTRLNLADGARLEPSEPVVILVSGGVTTGIGAFIGPSGQAINPMSAANIRIEAGGAVTLGDSTEVRAQLLAAGKITTGKKINLTGAAWAKTINIGPNSSVQGDGMFAAQPPPVPPPCNDNNPCTADECVSTGTAGFCKNTRVPSGTSCEDGNICNGAEVCDGAGNCQPGTNVGVGTSCADNDVCNGDELCDGFGSCVPGTPPQEDDHNPCTADACDPVTGVSHSPVPDGTPCFGAGVCQAGVCSVAGPTFTANFLAFQPPPLGACPQWTHFRSLLVDEHYSSITMRGDNDLGITCHGDPSTGDLATLICKALQQGDSSFFYFCDDHIWSVSMCGDDFPFLDTRLTVDDFCSCGGPDHHTVNTVRPCSNERNNGNNEWGGVNLTACGGQNQTITVVCVPDHTHD
jgi:hypothetical protein